MRKVIKGWTPSIEGERLIRCDICGKKFKAESQPIEQALMLNEKGVMKAWWDICPGCLNSFLEWKDGMFKEDFIYDTHRKDVNLGDGTRNSWNEKPDEQLGKE